MLSRIVVVVQINPSIISYVSKRANEMDAVQLCAKSTDIPHHLDVIDWDGQGGNTLKDACMERDTV